MKTIKIEISARTIIFIVVFLLLLQLLFIVKDLLFSLLIAFIIMSAVEPAVTRLQRYRIPRILSTIVIFVFFLLIASYSIFGIIPPLVTEVTSLAGVLPVTLKKIDPNLFRSLNLNSLTQYIPNITNNIFDIIGGVFSNVVFLLSTLFFALYFTAEEGLLRNLLMKFFNREKAQRAADIFDKVKKRMSDWFWGELTLMVVVGLMTYAGLTVIGLKYALPLALVAGLLEVVPNLGPVIATIPAVFIAATQSTFLILPTVILYLIVQQLENNVVVPMIMKRVVGLHPIITLVALIVGGKIGGVIGVLLSIPTTLFLETVIIELIRDNKPVIEEKLTNL